MISFVVPLKVNSRVGMNKFYAGTHWSERLKIAEEVHTLTKHALMAAGIPKRPFKQPVTISIYYNSRLDIDNHGVLAKMLIDGLKGWLIQDDSKKYVTRLQQGFWGGGDILIEIEEVKNE